MTTATSIQISRAFRNYLELKGYHRVPRSIAITKNSAIAKVYGYASIKDFSAVYRDALHGCTSVKLSIKDFGNEDITNGLFNLN